MRERISSKTVKAVLLLSLILFSLFLAWNYLSPVPLPIEQLRTKGRSIVDGRGKLVLLRGLNYLEITNRLERPPNTSELKQIKEWGFNVIRLPVYWEYLEPNQGEFNYTFIEEFIDPVVDCCQTDGMYLVLDMHQWHTSSYFIYEPVNESRGIGFPPWMCEDYDSEDQFLYDWWNNAVKGFPDAWDRLADLWCLLATRYRNYSYLAGYDLFNEPNRPYGIEEGAFNSQILPEFYQHLIERILEVDTDYIFFFEGQDGDTKPSLERPQTSVNLVYSQHAYTEGHTLQACQELIERATSKTRVWNLPLWIGEFGASQNATSFAYNMTSALNEKIEGRECSGWCWWCYLPEDSENSTSVVDRTHNPRPVLQILLDSLI